MDGLKMKVQACFLGIGKTGVEAVDDLASADRWGMRLIAADWDRNRLGASAAQKKVRILKNALPASVACKAVEKLAEEAEYGDLFFIAANMDEAYVGEYVSAFVHELKEYGTTVICILLMPSGSKDPVRTRRTRAVFSHICDMTAVVQIPIGGKRTYEETENGVCCLRSIGNYDPISYQWEDPQAILGQRALCEGKSDSKVISAHEVVGACVDHVMHMARLDYINAGFEAVMETLRTPGLLHLVEAQMYGEERAYVLERKLTVSNLGTDIACARGILIHLIVPPNLKKGELKYLCEHIPGRADPEAKIDLCITTEETLGDTVCAKLIATDVYTRKSWEEMSRW